MKHWAFSKLITFQVSIAFLDSKTSSVREDPFITFPKTDAAVAFCDWRVFWNLDAEFEGTTMAVAFVRLELCVGVWVRHQRNGIERFVEFKMEWDHQG